MLGNSHQLFGDVFRRKNEINTTRCDGAARHRVVFGGFILSERNATFGLDRLQSQCPVRSGARKDDADGPLVLVLGQRLEKEVDGPLPSAALLPWVKFQN